MLTTAAATGCPPPVSPLMDSERITFRILMFPWLAHGHISPFLELAKRILKKKNFHIYLCTTAINFSSVNQFIQTNFLETSIELVELHLEPNPLLPPHYHTTKNLPSNLRLTLMAAFQTAKSSFSDIISTLKPELVIYDIVQPWAANLASSRSIPAVHFAPFGAAFMSFIHQHYTTLWNHNFKTFPELSLQVYERKVIDSLIEFLCVNVFDQDKDVLFVNYRLSSEIVLLKTSSGLEGKYIDYVSSVSQKRILAVGPLVTDGDENGGANSDILHWLSKKEHHSTVYISFGSEYFLSGEEREEIAKGIELSGVNFIWVIRFPAMEKTISIEEALPERFLERVRGRGRVVSRWAPQTDILRHPSTGAYVSHCGWSSVNESIYFGVPIIAMPMKLDHHIDARMLVGAGACVEVPRGENEVFKGDEISKAINKVILEKTGEGLRSRVQELSEKVRIEEDESMQETAESLWQLCFKNKYKDC